MGMKEVEIRFQTSPMAKWHRRIKYLVWILFSAYVLSTISLLTFIPSCHLLDVPAASGCIFAGVNVDGYISILALFNAGFILGIAIVIEIIKMLLVLVFVLGNPSGKAKL